MKIRPFIFAIAVLPVYGDFTQAVPAEITGEDLYNICSSPDLGKQHVCGSYLLGLWDGLVVSGDLGGRYEVCPSSRTAPGAAAFRLIFLNWALRYPQLLTRSRSDAAAASIAEAFPCAPR
jgi:hypothetical protein